MPGTSQELLLLIALTSGMIVVMVGRQRQRATSWLAVGGVFLAASLVGYGLDPDRAGTWLAPPFALLVVVPLVAFALIQRRIAARSYRQARWLARLVVVLHPSRANRSVLQEVEIWRLAAIGELDKAEALLAARGAKLAILRLRQRWSELVAYIDAATTDPSTHPNAIEYVRALGEIGELDRMVAIYRELRTTRAEELASARLFVAAFLGQIELVDAICAGPLRHHSAATKRFWHATAEAVGGDAAIATQTWNELQRDPDWRLRGAADHRLAQPLARVTEPSPAATAAIAAIATNVRELATYEAPARTRLSVALVAAIVAIQMIAWWREQSDPSALYALGMFWAPSVVDGHEWWRLVTAMFLHAGWLHVTLNAFGLLWFGPFVERALGGSKFSIIYIAGGVGGFMVLAALYALGWREASAVVGASGGIMALIGASAAIFLRGSVGGRSSVAAKRLRDMLAFVVIQTVFDVLSPNVSMTGHVTGLVIGFALGLAMSRSETAA